MLDEKSICKAVREYDLIKKRGNFPAIYLDCEEGKAWCVEYTDCNSYTQYEEESIISLTGYINNKSQELHDTNYISLSGARAIRYARMAIKEYMKKREEERI